MSFARLLMKRLGPLYGLAPRGSRGDRPPPTELWLRRAVGIELVLRPRERRVRARPAHLSEEAELELSEPEAGSLVGLTTWTPGSALELPPDRLDALIEAGLVYWAPEAPPFDLPAARLPAGWTGRIARREGVWPTPAIETATAIQPMPFMPRDRDLAGAEMVGLRLATLERGHEIMGVTLLGDHALGEDLRALLPALDGTRDRAELEGLRGARARRRLGRLLEVLELVGALEAAPPEGLPAKQAFAGSATRVTWLGHAAVLLQAEGHALLVDPLFHAGSVPPADPHPRPDPRSLPPLDAILVTHGDNDHLSPNALAQLDPRVPVLVPRVREPPPPHQTDMEGVLRTLGCTDVRALAPFERLEVGPFEIHALPFEGEDWGLEQAQLTYLVEAPELSCFFAADSLGPERTHRWLAERARPVDLAFMGVSGAAEPLVAPPGLGYGNFYARWIPAARRQEFVLHTAGPAESARFCEIFRPRFAFGYAAGGAPFIRTEYADRGDHAAFAAALEASGVQPVALPLGAPVEPGALGALPPR